MSDTTQLIKDKLDIVDFLKQYVELKPAGKNFKARCPFHKEKTPSFMVSPERQSWHCFGSCSEGGDIIKFLMKYENIEFYDALKILAEKAGVELKTNLDRDFQSSNKLYKIMSAAKDFFKDNLSKSEPVKNYLKERGLKEETIKEFEIGAAPDGSDFLTRHLLKLGYNVLDIEKAGLALKTERGTYWDRFRARIMFPIYNHVGKVAAFTGRIMPGSENANVGKYVNSPETPIFQKSKILYGFHKTKNDIRSARAAVLVEGQMDLLMMWQDGVKNAVASSGTALTADHLAALRRLADELTLSFDADEAGQIAAERSIDLASAHDFSVKLLIIGDEKLKDPADVVMSQPGKIKDLVAQSKSAMEYYFYRHLKDLPSDIKLKKQNLRAVLSKIKNLPSPIDRNHWLGELSSLVKIEEKVLMEEMEALTTAVAVSKKESVSASAVKEDLSRRDHILNRLFGLLFHMKSDLEIIKDYLQYLPEQYRDMYKSSLGKSENSSNELSELMNTISLRFSLENDNFESSELEEEAKTLLHQLKFESLKERRRDVFNLIQKLEKSGDNARLQEALKEYNSISGELESNQ